MTLSWSVLALALMGAEGQQPSPPRVPESPVSRGMGVCKASKGLIVTACKVGAVGARDSCLATMAHQPCGGCVLLGEICANLCPEDIVDEMTVAAFALPSSVQLSPCAAESPAKTAGSSAGCQPMPKVAAPRMAVEPEEQEIWPMTLRDAIAIALDNSEIVRVITFVGAGIGAYDSAISMAMERAKREYSKGRPIVIARLNADASIWRFQAEVMAEVRSVEQQYWNLAQAHVQLWSADRAVTLAEEVLNREQAELLVGRGTVADVAEAQQRLEQFRLDLVTRTSDVITTERQLRNLLGLPPADNRRIIPVTPPTEARVEPDWDSSLAQMLGHQPDIVQQRLFVRLAELGLLVARNQLLPLLGLDALHQFRGLGHQLDAAEAVVIGTMLQHLNPMIADRGLSEGPGQGAGRSENFTTQQLGWTYQMGLSTRGHPLANTRQAQYLLIRSRARYRQVVHQTTHSLARFFLEIDANYRQLQTATRMRKAAAQRLDAQRAYYEEGRITIDRFLDSVSQYATAVAAEAQYRASYNVSIVALEEAKGTLLAYDNIVVAEGPRPRKALPAAVRSREVAQTGATAETRTPAAPVKAAPAQPIRADRASGNPSRPDKMVMTASLDVEKPKEDEVPPAKVQGSNNTAKAAAPAKAKTWSFSISIGGANPLQIKGTITSSGDASATAVH